MSEYLLPDVGEGLTEAEIVSWRVKAGRHGRHQRRGGRDRDREVPGRAALAVRRRGRGPAGPRGRDRAGGHTDHQDRRRDVAGTGRGPPVHRAPQSGRSRSTRTCRRRANPTLVGHGPRERAAKRRARKAAAAPASVAGASTQRQVQGASTPGGGGVGEVEPAETDEPAVPAGVPAPQTTSNGAHRTLAKPPVRKLARDLGVDLATLAPTGPNGTDHPGRRRGRGEHVRAVSRTPRRRRRGRGAGPAAEWREPIKGVRKMMGQAMVQLGVHRAARHGVGQRRRHPDQRVRRRACAPGGSSPTSRCRRCSCSPGPACARSGVRR